MSDLHPSKVISITSADMEAQPVDMIPQEIYEYRSLTKADLINKIVEAREELSVIKNIPIDVNDVKFTAAKKGEHSLAAELYALRQIIVDSRKIAEKARLKVEAAIEEEKGKETQNFSAAPKKRVTNAKKA